MLLQTDASDHAWLGDRGPRITLVAAIDDATGKVPYGLFREQEDAHGYFLLFREIVRRKGVPLCVYRDRHSIFEVPRRIRESVEEQLEGEQRSTQFGRLMAELGITSIPSNSPQARGRIERLWGTFQGRLTSELRLAGASTIDQANQVLAGFLDRYNRRFPVSPIQPGSAYRKPGPGFKAERVFCFKYQRTVGLDNVVRFGEHRFQIMPCNGRLSYARARVEVHERLDGSVAVYYYGQCLATRPAPKETPLLRTRKFPVTPVNTSYALLSGTIGPSVTNQKPKAPRVRPAPDHPWRHQMFIDRGSRG